MQLIKDNANVFSYDLILTLCLYNATVVGWDGRNWLKILRFTFGRHLPFKLWFWIRFMILQFLLFLFVHWFDPLVGSMARLFSISSLRSQDSITDDDDVVDEVTKCFFQNFFRCEFSISSPDSLDASFPHLLALEIRC